MAGILLVHGAWHGPWCWDGVAERLRRRGHQVEAVRLRGHDDPPGRIWHRVHHYLQDVHEAAARFIEPPVLVGHSLGGLVVQRYLERGRARGAVLLAPLPHHGTLPAIARMTFRHPLVMLEANLSLRLRPFVATPGWSGSCSSPPRRPRRWSMTPSDGCRMSRGRPSSTAWWCGPGRAGSRSRCWSWALSTTGSSPSPRCVGPRPPTGPRPRSCPRWVTT